MRSTIPTHPIAYADASFRDGLAGCGYVVRAGGRLVAGSHPAGGMRGSHEAEARAALLAARELLASGAAAGRLDIRSDSMSVVEDVALGQEAAMDDVRALLDLCEGAGVDLSVTFCRGHAGIATAAGFLNHCADRLAAMGIDGEARRFEIPYDAFWRMGLMGCLPDLAHEDAGLSRLEAAEYLGVPADVVDALHRNGHLELVWGRPILAAASLLRVRAQVEGRGHVIHPRTVPLPAMLGRVDDAESGFGAGRPSRVPVRAVVHGRKVGEDVATVISLEGHEGNDIFAVRLPAGRGPVWEPVLQGLSDLVWDRYPGCDRLNMVTDDVGLLDALNGIGRWTGIAPVEAMDARIRNEGLVMEARRMPPHWKAWQVRLAGEMMERLVSYGAEGAWEVDLSQGHTRLRTQRATWYEPPWAQARELSPAP